YGVHAGGRQRRRSQWGRHREDTVKVIPTSLLLIILVLLGAPALAVIPAPEGFLALDTPNDAGKSLSLVWKASPADRAGRSVQVWMATSPTTPFKKVAEFPSNTRYVKPGDFPWWAQPAGKGDHYVKLGSSQTFPIEDGKPYFIKLLVREGDQEVWSEVAEATAAPNLFNTAQINNLVFVVAFTGVLLASIAAGRPDAYKEDANLFITSDQFSYTAAVDGIMLREKPAANFFMGSYFAESLLLTETGAGTGAIQIAGTDSDHQLPFFVTTCDYTLIGEELYAASAYLSREPVLVGTLRGQDFGKAFIMGVLVIGTLLATIGVGLHSDTFDYALDLFKDFK